MSRVIAQIKASAPKTERRSLSSVILDVGEFRFKEEQEPFFYRIFNPVLPVSNSRTLALTIVGGINVPVSLEPSSDSAEDTGMVVVAEFGGKRYRTKALKSRTSSLQWRGTLNISLESVFDGDNLLPSEKLEDKQIDLYLFDHQGLSKSESPFELKYMVCSTSSAVCFLKVTRSKQHSPLTFFHN